MSTSQSAPVIVPTVTVYDVATGSPVIVNETDVVRLVDAGTHTTQAPKGATRKGATKDQVEEAADTAAEVAGAAAADAVKDAVATTGRRRK